MRIALPNINRHVPIAPLATFRALFGFIMLVSVIRFIANGWVDQLYINPDFYFTYPGFDWVKPLGTPGMYMAFAVMAVCASGIMLGWRYRITAPLFFLTFTYVELIDKTNYLNHYYFVSIIAFLLMLLPAHRYFSIDARRRPDIRVDTVPAWMINVIQLQLGLVYFFAGFAKINADWLLRAMPLKIWLAGKSDLPIIGPLFNKSWSAFLFSWTGMLYDLLIPFLLLVKRTRLLAYGAVVAFHILTALLFKIGMFPFIMIASTLIFFPAPFHQKLIDHWNDAVTRFSSSQANRAQGISYKPSALRYPLILLLSVHFTIQFAMPLRHTLYRSDLFWTEEGYRFSWRVMLMEKAGTTQFMVRDGDGRYELVDNSEFLTPYQEKMMSTQPDMILQYARHIEQAYFNKGFCEPKVTVRSYVTLNGRRSKLMIDPEVDLTGVAYRPGENSWIMNRHDDPI